MYNRYIRNDRGVYTRLAEEDAPAEGGRPFSGKSDGERSRPREKDAPQGQSSPTGESSRGRAVPPPPGGSTPGGGRSGGLGGAFFDSAEGAADTVRQALRRLLDRFHLERVDTGDLLLLLLLFLLFQEDADEELLFAIGLLLVL